MEKENVVFELKSGTTFEIDRYLNRYYTINCNLERSLKGNFLWFSDPKDFNDPYDCNMEVSISNDYDKILESLIKDNTKRSLGFTKSDLEQKAKYWLNHPEVIAKHFKENDEKLVSNLGICCFSKCDNALLMWSHYANKHNGICLTFDIRQDENFFSSTEPIFVDYPEKYPLRQYPEVSGDKKSIQHLIGTKSKEWQYENEIRLYRNSESHLPFRGEVVFNKLALIEVKFGYKTNENERIKINKWLMEAKGYEHVKFKKANLKKFEFGIRFEEVSL